MLQERGLGHLSLLWAGVSICSHHGRNGSSYRQRKSHSHGGGAYACPKPLSSPKPRVDTATLTDDITRALHRSWFFNPSKVHVSAEGGRIVLTGSVNSFNERQVAAQTAWSAPGATMVENDLAVN